MWPVGYPAFGPQGGPPAYVSDLRTGRLSERTVPAIVGGDYQPYAMVVRRQLVYVGSRGTMAVPASMMRKPHVLGPTPFFAPSARRGHVWLVYYRHFDSIGPVHVKQVPVSGGQTARQLLAMPSGTALVIRGTDAGFLLEVKAGHSSYDLSLVTPGSTERNLPYLRASSDAAPVSIGFDATARLVAYGTGCRWQEVAASAPQEADTGYLTCPMLRVLDVVTGTVVSVAAPRGTAGWVPNGFGAVSAISPDNHLIAAYAATLPLGRGRARLYVTRLSSGRPHAVPSSAALLFTKTAWSGDSAWLLYQGYGKHLWAYRVTTGEIRTSTTPCCLYTAMVAAPN